MNRRNDFGVAVSCTQVATITIIIIIIIGRILLPPPKKKGDGKQATALAKSFNSSKLLDWSCPPLCFKLFAKFIIVWITTNDFQIFVLMALEISPVIYFFAICVQILPGLGSLPFHFLHSEGFFFAPGGAKS